MTPQPQQRYSNLTMEQLRGADYALRILRTSVVIRGEALKVLDEQISEVREEMTRSRPAPAAPEADVLNECYTELMKHATEADGIDCIVLSDVEYVFGKLRQSQKEREER